MREFYVLEPNDSTAINALGSFKIKHPTLNKYWWIDPSLKDCNGSALRLDSTRFTTFTLDKRNDAWMAATGWAGLKTQDNKYVRHCGSILWDGVWVPGNFDFVWMFYKQTDGTYKIFNPFPGITTPGTYVGYDGLKNQVIIVNPGDSKTVNWAIERITNPAPTPVSTPVVSALAPSPAAQPTGTRTTSLPNRFKIKTSSGKYITNKSVTTSSSPMLSLNQTAPKVNFTIVTSGLYQLPTNYVALKDADVSASNSGHYHNSVNYISRGTFWSSAQGGGNGWAWQFYRQSDGKYIILNNKDGVNNYLYEPSFTTDWFQVTPNLSYATRFIIEDPSVLQPSTAPSPIAITPLPTTIQPSTAPSPITTTTPPITITPPPTTKQPMTPTPSPSSDNGGSFFILLSIFLCCCICLLVISYFIFSSGGNPAKIAPQS